MWLVPRDTRGLTSRTDVPAVVREALVRWYTGHGEDSDHRASVITVVKARDHHQWIACDCLGEVTDPPLLSPAYLSEAETYYLRRLTSIRQRRPEHDVDCPFFREQAPPRIREKATATPRTINEPDGLFSAHRLAPEKLAQLPDDDEPDDRTRGVAIPRLARLLWLLMEMAHVNVIEPLEIGEPREARMALEFARLRSAAERVEIAPGVPLARHFYTHIDPYERGIVFARLREAAKSWPPRPAPRRPATMLPVESDVVAECALDRTLHVLARALQLLRLALRLEAGVVARLADAFLDAAGKLVARCLQLVGRFAHDVSPLCDVLTAKTRTRQPRFRIGWRTSDPADSPLAPDHRAGD